MRIRFWLKTVVVAVCVLGLTMPAFAKKSAQKDNLVDVKTAWVTGQESFPVCSPKNKAGIKKKA